MSSATAEAPSREEIDRVRELMELSDGELQAIVGGSHGDSSLGAEDQRLASEVLEQRDSDFDGEKAAEVRSEAGEPTGEMQDERKPAPMPDVDQIIVDGTTQLSMFKLGGKEPNGASITLAGGACALARDTAFNKGERIRFSGEAIVRKVAQKDSADPKTGQVVSCEQQHTATIVDLVVDSAS